MSESGGTAASETSATAASTYQSAGSVNYSSPPSQPATPSSTVQDPPAYANAADDSADSKTNLTALTNSAPISGLPPFSSFSAADVSEGLVGRLASDGYLNNEGISSTRVMELSGWDYCYTDGRYLERTDGVPVMIPQPQYRPWESKQDGAHDGLKSGLPSFQSQFGEELVTTLTTLTPAACSPAPSVPSPGLPSFHTLSAVNPRYPLVPAPVQAREIPSIQQQFLDERHIHLFQGAPGQNFTTQLNNGATLTTLNNAQYHINNAQLLPSGQILATAPQSHILAPSSQILTSNGHIITSTAPQGIAVVSQNSTPTVLTVVKAEPVNIVELKTTSSDHSLTQLHHHPHFQNSLITQGHHHVESKFGLESPPRGPIDNRKKERRKIRASSLESSNESDGAMSVESSGQVAAVSSTASFKSPMTPNHMNSEGDSMITDTGDKQTKKKRKRCGECIGCQRKDNCGDCAPCRNDKSHQICKMRRCEKLTEKKHLLAYNREDGGVSYRGRGRGRGGRGSRGGFRGKAPRQGSTPTTNSDMNSTSGLGVTPTRDSVKMETPRGPPTPTGNPAIGTPSMTVPFYTNNDVWPPATTPTADPWTPQGQFIHQQMDDIRYQQYATYQTTTPTPQPQQTGYSQGGGFIPDPQQQQPSAFQASYGGQPAATAAAASTSPARPASNYGQVHTPTPSPIGSNPPTPHVNGHRNGMSVHYGDDAGYVNGGSFMTDSSMAPPPSSSPASRSNDGNTEQPPSNKSNNYMSGNEQPGYPASSPQQQSLCNSNGYPGQSMQQSEYGDQTNGGVANGANPSNQSYQTGNQKSPSSYHTTQPQPSPGYNSQNYSNNQNYNNPEQQSPSHNKHSYPQSSPKQFPPASPSYQMYDSRQTGYYEPFDNKSNVNARIKTMIMNKQGRNETGQTNGNPPQQQHLSSSPINGNSTDSRLLPDYNKKPGETISNESNHFLAFSHHLRDGSLLQPEGGGGSWAGYPTTPIYNYPNYEQYDYNRNNTRESPMERFVKFASADFDDHHNVKPESKPYNYHCKYQDPIRNLEINFPTKRSYEPQPISYLPPPFPVMEPIVSDVKLEVKEEPKQEEEEEDEEEEEEETGYPRVSYAPSRRKMEIIDRRFSKVTNDQESRNWKEYMNKMREEGRISELKKEEELYPFEGDGGPIKLECTQGAWCCRLGGTETPTSEHLRDGCCPGLQTADEIHPEKTDVSSTSDKSSEKSAKVQDAAETKIKDGIRPELAECSCFPPDKAPPEPGSYYTHLGAAANLQDLRKDVEGRLGLDGKSIRIEKIQYTGKEGKTTTGCPLAKWVIRRSGLDEKYLVMVKRRQGHTCPQSWVIVCIVAWDGVPSAEADKMYTLLTHKLNKFGLPTTRRCATNEPRTCACQGIDPDTCGTSFSFGCSWSMYYNGCKYARSKTVRKFRLSIKAEEQEVEERMHVLATILSPLYNTVAPEAFRNQTQFEREASECRLGFKPGRPFSGVTACIDFCAHAHRDLHNMNNGCTAVVSLTKHRGLTKSDDEQLHVLPLYIMEGTDEFGSKESQEEKYKAGSIECLNKFPCEVRVRAVPLQPCRRHGKKRKEDEAPDYSANRVKNTYGKSVEHVSPFEGMDSQLQSSQVSSTVMDSPVYNNWVNYPPPTTPEPDLYYDQWSRMNVMHDRKQGWMPSNNGSWEFFERDVVDADSTTAQNQAFSPCSTKSTTSYSTAPTNCSPLSSPMTPTNAHMWHTYDDDSSKHQPVPPTMHYDYPSTPSPLRHTSTPFRMPKSRPPSRPTPPDPFLRPYDPPYPWPAWAEPPPPRAEPIGEIMEVIDNEECFRDAQMGGVGIALGHGSVLFEVAKHELHATTALRVPNRLNPSRISLVFYQHRNLNRPKHGWDEWEEKMRLRKLGLNSDKKEDIDRRYLAGLDRPSTLSDRFLFRANTYTTTTWTTLFPMKPCMVTGPYQERAGE